MIYAPDLKYQRQMGIPHMPSNRSECKKRKKKIEMTPENYTKLSSIFEFKTILGPMGRSSKTGAQIEILVHKFFGHDKVMIF